MEGNRRHMRLEREQYEEIKQTVIDTFSEYGVKCTPISAFELAIKMGFTLVAYSSLGNQKKEAARQISLDGFTVETLKNQWLIYYNDEDNSYGRINQTIMHEIGHYALGHIEEGKIEEAEANFFAKYALAPPPLIHTLIANITPLTIMKAFDISYQAAGYAYKYYQSWLYRGEYDYTDYELKLLELFKVA